MADSTDLESTTNLNLFAGEMFGAFTAWAASGGDRALARELLELNARFFLVPGAVAAVTFGFLDDDYYGAARATVGVTGGYLTGMAAGAIVADWRPVQLAGLLLRLSASSPVWQEVAYRKRCLIASSTPRWDRLWRLLAGHLQGYEMNLVS